MAAGMQWRDRANGFFTSSSVKLRTVTQTAGIFVGDVAKDAGTGVAEVAERAVEVAERAGTAVRTRWSLLQQARQQQQQQARQQQQQQNHYSQETVQDRLKSAAASTSTLLKRSFFETKEKVAVGRTKVEEAAKRAAQRSRSILVNIERWQKGQMGKDVFGVPLEILVQKQKSSRPIPQIVINCVDYLVLSGLNSEYIFKYEGDQQVVQRLKSSYEEDWNAPIPEGTSPIDVAALLKIYLQMLPEPLLTFNIYDEVKAARGNARQLRDLLRTIPYAHYSTLECLSALLFRISQKSALNKMDTHSLAFELAPLLLWKKSTDFLLPQKLSSNGEVELGTNNRSYSRSSSLAIKVGDSGNLSERAVPKANGAPVHGRENTDNWSDIRDDDSASNGAADFSTQIPLDDEPVLADFAIVEAVQCLIEQQNVVFVDAIEAIWQELGS